MHRKYIVTMSASLVALAVASPVSAQSADTDTDGAIGALNEQIVVTATKKAQVEDVQDVPLAVTAFNDETIEILKVRDLGSLSYAAPNVSLDQVGTTRGVANFSVRGLGINSGIPSVEPTVGVFVDGVYLGTNNGVSFDLFDLGSVELVRGPQGILFGRNTTGGAVLLNTGNPTDTLQAKARIAYDGPVDSGRGSGSVTVQGTVSGPIIADILNFKLGAYHNRDRGYFRNLFDGARFGEANTVILRGALEFKPSERVTLMAKGEIFDSSGDGPAGQNHGIFSRDSFDFSINNRGLYDARSKFATLRADIEMGETGKITNIFGYRDYEGATDADIDSTPLTQFHSPTWLSQKQLSNELRYANSFGALDLTIGGYWFTQEIAYDEARFIGANSFYGGGRQNHDVYGIFAALDYDVTNALTLSAGIRWSQEDKEAAITYVRPRAACSVIANSCPTSGKNPTVPAENNGFVDAQSWKNWTPRLGAQYRIGEGAQIYASWTRGFRSGGYNFRITAPAAFEAIAAVNGTFAFDEEKVDSYELGVKFQTADHRLTLNAAAFRTDIKGMQREVNQASASSGVAQSIFNTADTRINGLELEGRFAVTDSLFLSGNLGLIDADYQRILFDISGDGVINATDMALALPRVPKTTWGVGLLYERSLGDASSLIARINFQHRDRAAYTDSNYGWLNAFDQLDAGIDWKANGWLTLSFYGKNLLDQVQFGGDTQVPFGGALSDGNNRPFDPFPAAGTFSPLNKGRVVGVEATFAL